MNHLVHARAFFAGYSCCKTSPHTYGSDAENPQNIRKLKANNRRSINFSVEAKYNQILNEGKTIKMPPLVPIVVKGKRGTVLLGSRREAQGKARAFLKRGTPMREK